MNNTTNQSDQNGVIATADEPQTETSVRFDFELAELQGLMEALPRVLSIPAITQHLQAVIELVPNYGLRTRFSMLGQELGWVVIRSPGNGSIDIEADTVLQDLEHRTPSQFHVDSFGQAASWMRRLGTTLANLDESWDCTQIIEAAEMRMGRL